MKSIFVGKTVVVIITMLVSFSCFPCSAETTVPDPSVAYVGGSGPENYSSIQEAIHDVAPGGTVFVYSGVYYEDIVINKKMKVIGEDKNSTIIDACGKNVAVKIMCDGVCFENFFVTNATDLYWPDIWELGALSIINSYNVSIVNNRFTKNFIAILLLHSHECVVSGNDMQGCGIVVWDGPGRGNLEAFLHNIDQSNQVNNKTVYYYRNETAINHNEDAGQIIFVNCQNSRVMQVSIDNVSAGIQVCYSMNITIENCTLVDIKSTGLHMDHSNKNTVRNCVLLRNDCIDFVFLDCSSYNLFSHNVIHAGGAAITLMRNSNHNLFVGNSLSGKKIGSMLIDKSNWNVVRQNNIAGSSLKRTLNRSIGGDVLLSGYSYFNTFDENYWSEWKGNDHPLLRWRPKVIFGVRSAIINPRFFPPFIDFDRHPACEPYLI